MTIKRIKVETYKWQSPQRTCSINYLRSVRDDRYAYLIAKAHYAQGIGVRSPKLDGMPKGKHTSGDVIGDIVVNRREVANDYLRAHILYARSISDLERRCSKITNVFAKDMMVAHYVESVTIKNLMVKHMMSRHKVYQIINAGLDSLYDYLDDEWKE